MPFVLGMQQDTQVRFKGRNV